MKNRFISATIGPDFVIRQVVSLYNQGSRGKKQYSGSEGQSWAPDSWRGRYVLDRSIWLPCSRHHFLHFPNSTKSHLYNFYMQDKTLLSKLPPAFSLHTESQRTTSVITQYGPDSTEMHKTSHRHEHTHLKARLDKQAACADICWFNILFLQNLIWDGRNDCTKSWLRTLAIQSRTMCYPFSFSRLHSPAKFPQQQN